MSVSNPSHRPIGIYDSGIGGLTVLKTLIEQLPNEKFIYFADTANLPYGNKTPGEIIQFSHNIISWFQNTMQTKLVIAACHTSSALALNKLSDNTANFDIPIIGTIYPMLNTIINSKQHNNIGIIATKASIESKIHENIFKAHGFNGKIVSISCPNFVPIIEADSIDHKELDYHAEIYLREFIKEDLDTLIFGCTHYPLIKTNIAKLLPKHIKYIDPAEHIARDTIALLTNNNLLNSLNQTSNQSNLTFYCSKDADKFGSKIKNILHIHADINLHMPLQYCLS